MRGGEKYNVYSERKKTGVSLVRKVGRSWVWESRTSQEAVKKLAEEKR